MSKPINRAIPPPPVINKDLNAPCRAALSSFLYAIKRNEMILVASQKINRVITSPAMTRPSMAAIKRRMYVKKRQAP